MGEGDKVPTLTTREKTQERWRGYCVYRACPPQAKLASGMGAALGLHLVGRWGATCVTS